MSTYTVTQRQMDEDEGGVAQRTWQKTSNGYGGPDETQDAETDEAIEFADEIVTETDEAGYDEAEEETAEAGAQNGHSPMSSPTFRPKTSAKKSEAYDGTESGDSEYGYEALEGFDESQLSESSEADENDQLVEAFYADPGAAQEFFPALAALAAPIAKAALPVLASAVMKQGANLSPKMRKILKRLSMLGLRVPIRLGREFGEEYGDEFGETSVDEAIDALEAQVEAMEVVIGKDDRVQVKNTKVVPWNRICHLKIKAGSGKSYLGTGFYVNRRTIITAGHCVYIHGQGGWAKDITVTPGRNASAEPYGKVTATSFRSVRGWVTGKSRNYDYGAIILPRNLGNLKPTSSFGFARYTDSFLLSKRVNTAGYPGDKPAGTMWYHGLRTKSVTPRTIVYDIDTYGGQSGSPVWIYEKSTNKRIVVGIHTNGSPTGNSATRITAPVQQNLLRWRNEGA